MYCSRSSSACEGGSEREVSTPSPTSSARTHAGARARAVFRYPPPEWGDSTILVEHPSANSSSTSSVRARPRDIHNTTLAIYLFIITRARGHTRVFVSAYIHTHRHYTYSISTLCALSAAALRRRPLLVRAISRTRAGTYLLYVCTLYTHTAVIIHLPLFLSLSLLLRATSPFSLLPRTLCV